MPAGAWDWLEVSKLLAGILSPVVIAIMGVYLHKITKKFEHTQWHSQKLIEKRLAIYEDIAPLFNDLLCYFTYVGSWRDVDPPKVVALKRQLDKKIHLAAPLFNSDFLTTCLEFQNLCFATNRGWGQDAALKTQLTERKRVHVGTWNPDWDTFFSREITSTKEIKDKYNELMCIFSREIGVFQNQTVNAIKKSSC